MIERIAKRLPTRWLADERQGFSLVEILVVLALLGMVVLVGMPALGDWLERYRVRTASQNLAANIQLQRMRAVSRNRTHSIQFNQGAGTYTLFEGDPNNGLTMIDQVANGLPQGVTFSGAADPIPLTWQGNDDFLVFHPDGSVNERLAQEDGILLTNILGDTFQVVVNQVTGRVQVIAP